MPLFSLPSQKGKKTDGDLYREQKQKRLTDTRRNRRAFCMRMRQNGLLKCHRSIFCELFTFSTSICRLFSGAE